MSNSTPALPDGDQHPLPPASPSTESDDTALSQLLSADQSAIQQLIDNLQSIDKYNIELPRIIACGNQSSGKSSVLEAISRLDFPRGGGLCTSFATELTLSRRSTRDVSLKIRWDKPGKADHDPPWTSIQMDKLSEAITDAKTAMERHNGKHECSFFRDVLQVQASDPSWPNLTLIDLPGLVSVNKKQHDVKTAKNILRHYIAQEKTLILAVVNASDDNANQKILELVKEYDPDGNRTMGIITKPDRVEGTENVRSWVRMAKNHSKEFRCGLGWHVVRNRGPEESNLSFHERDVKEAEYFSTSPWKELKPEQLGIDNLRVKLSKIFEKHTREALPGIVSKLYEKLEVCEDQLGSLGPPRSTLDEQQSFLADIACQFETLIRDAIAGDGNYKGNFFNDRNMKLRAVVRNQNDTFVEWMYGWGASYETKESPAARRIAAPVVDMDGNLAALDPPEVVSHDGFLAKARDIQRENRVGEIQGTFNPNHINTLFRSQSTRWGSIGRAHVEQVWHDTCNVLKMAAMSAARNEHTAQALIRHVIEPEMHSKWVELFEKFDEILRPYEKFHAITQDRDFLKKKMRLQEETTVREYLSLLQSLNLMGNIPDKAQIEHIRLQVATKPFRKPEFASNSDEMVVSMQLYYEDALRTFINNVVVLVIESTLLYDLTQIFTPNRVHEMRLNPEGKGLLKALAGEPEEVRGRRDELLAEKHDLTTAIESCKEKLGDAWVSSMNSAGPRTRGAGTPFRYHPPGGLTPRSQGSPGEHSPRAASTPVRKHRSARSSVSESGRSSTTSLSIHDDGARRSPSRQVDEKRRPSILLTNYGMLSSDEL